MVSALQGTSGGGVSLANVSAARVVPLRQKPLVMRPVTSWAEMGIVESLQAVVAPEQLKAVSVLRSDPPPVAPVALSREPVDMKTECIDRECQGALREDGVVGYVVELCRHPPWRYRMMDSVAHDEVTLTLSKRGRFGSVDRARLFESRSEASEWVEGFLRRVPKRERLLYELEVSPCDR